MLHVSTEKEDLLYMGDLELYGKSKDDLKALMNNVRSFTKKIKMKFGISKCATLVIKRGRKMEDYGIQIQGELAIGHLGDNAYKYLEVLKAYKIRMEEIMLKVKKEYYREVRKFLE